MGSLYIYTSNIYRINKKEERIKEKKTQKNKQGRQNGGRVSLWRHGGRGDASCFMTRSRQGLCSQFLLINFFFIYFAQEGGTLLVYLIYFFLQKINQNSGSVALPFGLVITQTGTHCAVQVLPPTAKQHTTSPHCARMISSSQKKGLKKVILHTL